MPKGLCPRLGRSVLRAGITVAVILGVFGLFLLALGRDPIKAYRDTITVNLLNPRGLSQVLVRMAPLLLTALAVAVPFKAGLINIGAEGQFMFGAFLGTWVALNLGQLPLVLIAGMVGGAIWGAIPGILKAFGIVNETISTLLLNYIAPLIVGYFVFGPWRAPELAMYPQTPEFPETARLPALFGTRLHLGFFLGLFLLVVYAYLLKRSRWGLELRTVGGNPEAARRLGLPVEVWIVVAMAIGGALAGLAGIAEVAAIHGRLKMAISPGYGFMGFLVNWLALSNPFGILVMSFLMAFIASSGFTLQITQRVPYAAINVLMGLILFVVLAKPLRKEAQQ